MPKTPGVRVRQETLLDTLEAAQAELPTCVIGKLYNVVVKGDAEFTFDPLDSDNQAFSWPGKMVGTVVDLAGTRNGLIDSQRKKLADFVPEVFLVDGTSEYSVDDSNIETLSQSGFDLKQGARSGLIRASLDLFFVTVNGVTRGYNPEGGLSAAKAGDRFAAGGSNFTVLSRTDTSLYTIESLDGQALTPTRVASSDTAEVSVVPSSALPGRVNVNVAGGPDFSAASVGDLAITHVPMPGLTSIQGALTSTTAANLLTFGTSVSLDDVAGRVVRVLVSTDNFLTVSNVLFTTLTAIDTVAGTATFADPVGVLGNDVRVTVFEGQLGYIETKTDSELVVVVPNTFSDSNSLVEFSSTTTPIDVYPVFDVKATYRALRKDLTGQVLTAGRPSTLLEAVGHSSVHYKDGLAFAVNVVIGAQPGDRVVSFIPVDDELDTETGLPENRDLLAGYQTALEAAESIDVYNMILLDSSSAIDSALENHVLIMSTEQENAWRRGYFFKNVPKGETESVSGLIEPGRVAGGVVTASNSGNKVIRDAGVDFVTGASITAGTKVVVEFPPVFAGEYVALGTTTDNDLILDGLDFTALKEFEVVDGSVVVNTSGGYHVFTGAPVNSFIHVEPGDYIEATLGGTTTYRMRVISVLANGSGLTAQDEVAGAITFGPDAPATGVSVVRSWDTVRYHVRPLSKDGQVQKLITDKPVNNRRFTITLNYEPTMEVGLDANGNPVEESLSAALTLASIAAKRSGLNSYDEISNLILGAGIKSVRYGYNHFKKSQKEALSDAGYTIVAQKGETAPPYIVDMITSDATGGIVTQEELVTANADWQSKSLVATYQSPAGSRFQILTNRLMGIRALQLDAILKAWVNEGRLLDFYIVKVARNENNKRQTDIQYVGIFPVAEKEIEFTIQMTV